jgi:hypothetical protein
MSTTDYLWCATGAIAPLSLGLFLAIRRAIYWRNEARNWRDYAKTLESIFGGHVERLMEMAK